MRKLLRRGTPGHAAGTQIGRVHHGERHDLAHQANSNEYRWVNGNLKCQVTFAITSAIHQVGKI